MSAINQPSKAQSFWLLAVINLFVGAMVGLERSIVPLLGEQIFGLKAGVAVSTFIVSFSLSKALLNLVAGIAADRWGRKVVLVLGWLIALPIPLLLIFATSWTWVLVANVLLGMSQALTWSMTVNMMVDLVPAHRRGFAAGINEFAGYLGVSILAFLTGLVASRFGLRPEPFYLGIAVAVLGLVLSLGVRETMKAAPAPPLAWVRGVGLPSLFGAATNLKDGLVWLALPFLLSQLSLAEIGAVAGLYPFVWALGQPFFGPLSDRYGRRIFISVGLALQGLGLAVLGVASSFLVASLAAVILGLGTAMVYPTLIAAVADRVATERRATALGVYRFFRDSGYALGAVIAGIGLVTLTPTLLAIALLLSVLAAIAWFRA